METNNINLKKIDIHQFIELKKRNVIPVNELMLQNIKIPPNLKNKKVDISNDILINIRQLFNSLTKNNIENIKKELRELIVSKSHTSETIESIANEILLNFIISEQNIKNFMNLLNEVSLICVFIGNDKNKKDLSPTIGNFFLNKCREMIFYLLEDNNIKMLAELDQDNIDDLDIYNKGREKIINLIITICYLYGQRNTKYVKLLSSHVYPLMNLIIDKYNKNNKKMQELGNPYEEECLNEEEYLILNRMNILYAEQLYTFLEYKGEEIIIDETKVKEYTLKELAIKFKEEIMPTLTEAYLISKCKNLKCYN